MSSNLPRPEVMNAQAEVERERKLRDSWYERCHEAEAEARRQRMRAEKAEAALAEPDWQGAFERALVHLLDIDRERLEAIARAEKAEAEVAHLQSVLDGISDPHHVVEIRATDYGLQHPQACRPDLLACPIHQAMEDLGGPPMPAGRYRVELDGDGEMVFTHIGEDV